MTNSEPVVPVHKLGGLSSGAQRGMGLQIHLMPQSDYCFGGKSKAICGTQPGLGRRSVGWGDVDENHMAMENRNECPRCFKKLTGQGLSLAPHSD